MIYFADGAQITASLPSDKRLDGVVSGTAGKKGIFLDGVRQADVAAWSPSDITTLAWYDASDSDTITISTGTDVSGWSDKSGNSRDLFQSEAIKQGTWNSSDEISFTTAEFMRLDSAFMYANGSIEIFFVGRSAAGSNATVMAEGSSTIANAQYSPIISRFADEWEVWLRNDAGSNRIFYSDVYNLTDLFDGSTDRLLNFRDDGSNVAGYLNSTLGTSVAYTRADPVTLDRFSIGGHLRSGNTVLQGSACTFKELIICDTLSAGDRASMIAYLEAKHSV